MDLLSARVLMPIVPFRKGMVRMDRVPRENEIKPEEQARRATVIFPSRIHIVSLDVVDSVLLHYDRTRETVRTPVGNPSRSEAS